MLGIVLVKPLGNLTTVIFEKIGKSLSQGAATTIYAATAPELNNIGGTYFSDCKEEKYLRMPHTYNQDYAERLWKLSEELTQKFE